MIRTQIQFPGPLYRRLKDIAEMNDWPLAEVVRRASELYIQRFPKRGQPAHDWRFPTVNMGGDFLTDPAVKSSEADAIGSRSG